MIRVVKKSGHSAQSVFEPHFSKMAAFADGSYVTVRHADLQDDLGLGIVAQRFSKLGTATGPMVRVNREASASPQQDPAVATLADGGFVVTWLGAGPAGVASGVWARRFGADDAPAGREIKVNQGLNGVQYQPEVAALPDGGFVVGWFDASIGVATGKGAALVRAFRPDGLPAGGEVQAVGPAASESTTQGTVVASLGDDLDVVISRGDAAAAGPAPAVSALPGLPAELPVGLPQPDPQPLDDPSPPAVAVHGEARVNTYTPDYQWQPSVAAFADGSYVVVWTSREQDGSGDGIYAQRFSAVGIPVGPEFRVNATTANTQEEAQVTSLSSGGFVVVWTDRAKDGSSYGIYSQRYDANGVAQGGETRVNTTTSSTQYQPAVDSYDGGYVVTWASFAQDGSSYGIYAQRFTNAGALVGGEFRVNTFVSNDQFDPHVAARADGSFVVTWSSNAQDGSGYGVYFQRYDSAGVAQGSETRANTATSGNQYEARVAVLAGGGFVLVWRSDNQDGSSAGVYAQRYDASGVAVGGEFRVNESTVGGQYQPDVTALANGGFAVAWYNDNYDVGGTGSLYDVYVREYAADGTPVGGQIKANTPTPSQTQQWEPAIAHLGNDNFVVVWRSDNQDDGTYSGIYQRLFGDPAELPRQANPQVGDFTGTVTFGENLVNATPQVIDVAVSVSDADSANFDGGRLELFYVQFGSAEDQLGVRNQGNAPGQIGVSGSVVSFGGTAIGTISGGVNGTSLVVALNANATPDAVEALVQNLTYANTSGNPQPSRTVALRLSDGDGGANTASTVRINVTGELDGTLKAHGESQVNTYTPSEQSNPHMARLADGSYVTVWHSNGQDGSSYGIYAQRMSASGVAVGPEFRVNSTTSNSQEFPQVAALSSGGFVVVWTDLSGADGSSYGVYAQRYDAAGVAQGGEFRVNTVTNSVQYQPSVAAYGGGFVVSWSSFANPGGNGYDIYTQRFTDAGALVGGEVRVNTVITGTQDDPHVAARADGSHVVVWTDQNGADGNSYGVYAQRYDAAGAALGGAILVNTFTTGAQYEPRVAMLTGGGFVVVWRSDNQDGSSAGVYGQRFNADGTKAGLEFRVNEYTSGGQYQPDVIGLPGGGFVVAFYNDANPDGQGDGDIWIREYDAAGTPVDGDRRVNTYVSSTQSTPALVDLGNGNYAVAWSSYGQDASNTYGVYQQLFGDTAELPRQSNPELTDFTGTVTFAENAVNAGLQVIDASVGLYDPDSGNFNGGRLDLYYVQGGAAEDQLGVVHQGNGPGQIGVSGNVVSYGGTAIGTISGGVNGANLRIDFTSNAATLAAVEALVERLGYANTDSSPNAARTVGLRVSDGDGGSSAPNVLTINVTEELDGTPKAYGETQVNTYTPNQQEYPSVAALNDGSYVVTWTSNGQDGSNWGIYAQRFSASGVAVGAEFRVNTLTTNLQGWPHVAKLSDGGFVITWHDVGNDGSSYGVYAQRYDTAGVAQGGQVLVNTHTNSDQYFDDVASYNGGFAVVWASTTNPGGNGYDIYLQRFDNAGAKVGGELRVSNIPASANPQVGTQSFPDVAAYANGDLVIVWHDSQGNDGSSYGVFGRLYDADTGTFSSTFLVNTTTNDQQTNPDANYLPQVAVLADGKFVVVWPSYNQDSVNTWGVYGQLFNADGSKFGAEFRINDYTSGGQYNPAVTALSTGGFVVSFFNDQNPDGQGDGDVWIREYTNDGVALDGERRVNTYVSSTQWEPAIADLGNGNFVVAWGSANNQDGSNYGIYQQLFGSTAELPRQSDPVLGDVADSRLLSFTLGSPFDARNPQVIDTDVDLKDADSANFDGGRLIVQFLDGTPASHANETVAIRNQGTGAGQIGVSGSDVTYGGTVIGSFAGGTAGTDLVVTFNANATPVAVQALVENVTYLNSVPGATQTDRYIGFRVFDGDGGASFGHDVLVRIQATVTPTAVDLQDVRTAVTLSETQAQAGAVLDDAVQFVYSGANSFNGGTLTVTYVSNVRPEDQLYIRNEGNGAGQVGVSGANISYGGTLIGTINAADNGVNGDQLIITFNASATDQAIERVVENLGYRTTSDGPLATRTISIVVRDSAAVASTARNIQIDVTPEVDGGSALFGERQVNTYTAGDQGGNGPVVARLEGPNAGGHVVLWTSNGQDGSSVGIYGQRYDAKGAPVGAEFQVNTYTLNDQGQPEVVGLANGGFVAVWYSNGQDGSGYGVYAQRYDAQGAPAGTEFRVNTSTASNQYEPAVVALTDGTFVVAYRSDYTSGPNQYLYDVLAQRFDANGNPQGGEFTINTTTAGTQFNPRLAALPGGQYVVVYGDANGADGSGYGVFARVFNADGTQAVAEQRVNTGVSGNQLGHDVAALAGGGWVAVWESADNQIYGQRFDAAGAKLGGEFQVSTTDTTQNTGSNFARVAALESGGFVVMWDSSSSNIPNASSYDVFVQQYDAAGVKVDGPLLVNQTTASLQWYGDVAALTGSNFVVAWAGNSGEQPTQSGYGVFERIFGTPGSITRSADPVLTDVTASVTFAENVVNATPQLIDTAVTLTDADSASFAGGQLVVGTIPAGQNQADLPFTQDQLGIRNQGTGAGQIGVSGSNVTFGGVVIGTIGGSGSNGVNGADLVVTLNASATAAAVEALIENLTYANTATQPAAARQVSIQVSDGAGGASVPRVVTINVTPEVDGASALFGDRQVNTYTAGDQGGNGPVVARLQGPNAGGHVVLWTSNGQDGSSVGIYGQRYDAKGAPVGAEFQVNTYTLSNQGQPEVVGLANGGFVAVWYSSDQDGSGYGVYAQRYDAQGAPAGTEFRVNTSTLSNQYEPAVVALTDGTFVVAYRSDYTNGPNQYLYDVLAQRFDANGNPLGGEFTVNTTTAGTQFNPRMAALPGGQYVVVYGDANGADGSGYGVFARVFNADGTQAVAEQRVNTGVSGNQQGHDVVALAGGGWVAVWESADNRIYGQRFDAAGAKLGGEFQVSTTDTTQNTGSNFARVAALESGGFVVMWDSSSSNIPNASSYDVFVQQYDAAGVKVDGPLLVNQTTASLQWYGDVAGLTGSNFVVAWAGNSGEQPTQSGYGVFERIFGTPGSITRSADPVLSDVVTSVTFAENVVNATPQLIDTAVSLADADSASFAGGQLIVSSITSYGNINQAQLPLDPDVQDQLGIRNQGTGAGQIGVSGSNVTYGGVVIGTIGGSGSNGVNGADLVVTLNANATAIAVEALIENLTYANTASNPFASRQVSIQVSDGAGGASVPRVVTVNVTPDFDGGQPLYQEEVVNTYTPSNQDAPAMAKLADGGYVTVWSSQTQDGWGYGIYAQRYDAQGVAVGNQFQVNDYTPFDQTEPAVAPLAGGGFVVIWRSQNQDGSGAGIFGQRYDADSNQVGDSFLVNTGTSSNQYQASVASFAGGGFVVAWYSDAFPYDVYFQRFDNSGNKLGAETKANVSAGFENQSQYEPSVTVLSDQSFVVTWRGDGGQDGNLSGVFARRFASDGSPLGGEFRINTYTDSYQYEPSIAALTGGGFVVAWTSYYQDGEGTTGVFAQRYANDGTPQGPEFRVNTTTASSEQQPSVTALANGGFVIGWSNGSQVYAQQFAANGTPIDGELRVDVKDNSWATDPVVLGLGGGNFVVSWRDYRDDANADSYGIFQRLFGNPADFSRQANPQIVDLAQTVTFLENDINLVPAVIDPGVGLVDPDSANFDGGRLEVDYISGYGGQDQLGFEGLESQDQLGIRNEGNGPTQVGVSGTTVSYGGVAIGTILSNGANHGKLVVEFNASATAEAVESVIENLTYQNISSNPFASRTISLRVSDGDGGISDPRFITINVTPSVDGAVPLGPERIVNTTVAGNQLEPAVARLADGGYVVVWEDQGGADGSGYGVYGQRYDADNNAAGSQFRVNTTTSSNQYEPQVAGLPSGGFVVVWRSDTGDGSGTGVYAQRYAADGTAVGGEFRVNTTTANNQYQPDVTAHEGGFVVTWYHDNVKNGEYYDIYFQRYDQSGNALGPETKANTPISGNAFSQQYQPSIAWLEDGGFVVVWRSEGQDGSGAGVYGQRFTAGGVALGPEFRINSFTDSGQYEPDVAALGDGGFVVAWRSDGQDLSGAGVYAQRYDVSGVKVGNEFRVSSSTSSNQYQPTIAGLENGGWVVSWYDDGLGDVMMQQYDSGGRQIDGQTRVNTYRFSTQQQPAVVSMADGGFVVAYAGYISSGDGDGDGLPDGGNNTYEIRLQRYSNTAPILTDVTANGLEDTPIVLTDELFISGFVDPEGQNLAAIKVVTLPAFGTLTLDGVPVNPGQEIGIADLQADKLVYLGNPDYFGQDQFAWTGSDGVTFAATPVFTNINVANVNDPPGLEAGPDDTANEGTFFSHAVVLDNPDPDTVQVTVNWGDGTPNTVYNTSNDLLNITHFFPDDGVYTVTVTANDQQGQPNSIEVDSFTVTVSNVAPGLNLFGDATVERDQTYTLTLGGVFDPGDDTVTEYRISWGDGTPVQVIAAADLPPNRQVTHVFTTTGIKTVGVSLVDEDGTFTNVATKQVDVAQPAEVLVVDAGPDRTVNEGALLTQTITFTDPTDTDPAGRLYTIDWGDGTITSDRTFQLSFNVSHRYADQGGPYTVNVTVDDDGAQSDTDSFVVTVNNVAPTINLFGNASVNEGSDYTLQVVVSDPGNDTITAYTLDWGDGSPVVNLTPAEFDAANGTFQHVYADGTQDWTITVGVVDEDGSWSNTKDITVNNVRPSIALTGDATVVEGSVYSLTIGPVTDPGQDTATSYIINWGDGSIDTTVDSLGTYTHVYADGFANRTISVVVVDEDGSHANAGTWQVQVLDVAPTVELIGAASVDEGALYTVVIGPVSDPGADSVSLYTIDWGDGSPTENYTATQLNALGRTLSHTYADGTTTPTIAVDLVNEDGTYADAGTKAIIVNNVAPTITLTGADTVAEAAAYTLGFAPLVDPGADTATQYRVAWGDGTQQVFTAADWASLGGTLQHVYADGAAARTIQVFVTDEDGEFLAGTKLLTVENVAPTLVIGGAASSDEAATYVLSIAGSDAAGDADPLEYEIDWGDGSGLQTLTAAELAALGGNVAHVFADDEDGPVNATVREIRVTVRDGDGGESTEHQQVTVNNVAPTLGLTGADQVVEDTAYVLTLGPVVDPGTDVVSQYVVDWGDGTVETIAAGDLPGNRQLEHVYATPGDYTISVDLVDEDGTFEGVASKPVTVNAASDTVAVNAGPDVTLAEGTLFTRTVLFTDGEDNGAAGWSYEIDYGDGTVVSGTTLTKSLDLSHLYGDGDAGYTVTVTVTDEAGESASDSFAVTVDNVAPTAVVSGAATVAEGETYQLSVGAVVDPGADTITGYSIDWGDGTVETYTPAEWAAAAGSFGHEYADGTADVTIVVSATDEDGTWVLGSQSLTVENVAPELVIGGAASTDEGATYVLSVAGSDAAGAADPLEYEIDWGDGTVETYTAAELAGLGGNVTHVFADDEDGPVNATARTISVTVRDGDGGEATEQKQVTVNNVAPTIALAGAAVAEIGVAYTLTLGAVVDPGTDTVSEYRIDWGDGTPVQVIAAADLPPDGQLTYTYSSTGARTISVTLVDEDGTHSDAGLLSLDVAPTTVRIGDAPTRLTTGNPTAWVDAWTDANVAALSHKADATDAAEAWSAVRLDGLGGTTLPGGDIAAGDLGVSGVSLPTSTVRQEIDGREALRIDLNGSATEVTLGLSRFFINDDGTLFVESGRVRLLDADGNVVGESVFRAQSTTGLGTVTVASETSFTAIEISAGVDDGNSFVFGGYADDDGGFGSAPYVDDSGRMHGSDFMLDWVEFRFDSIGGP